MRKSRLKILPARCLAQLGFLLLYLACPILGEMSRAQPDHGLASSLTLHVLEHCASPPKDPGDGSCSTRPEDTKVMTRNENGPATCSVATHLLNLATKCAPEDQLFSEQSSKVTTVTMVPRRLLAARSKLPTSSQEPIKMLPKRQLRHRSLKRDADVNIKDSSVVAGQILVHSERDAARRTVNIARRTADDRRNTRTERMRTINMLFSDNFRSVTAERLNSRNLNRVTFRSTHSRDTNRVAQSESGRFRRVSYSRVSYSRVTPSDARSKMESFERSVDNRRYSPLSAERMAHESNAADRRSTFRDTRLISASNSLERRMESRTPNYAFRRLSGDRTLLQRQLNERRSATSRTSAMESSSSSRRALADRRLQESRIMETDQIKSSRRFISLDSRTAVREQLSQTRETEIRLQRDEPRRSVLDRKLHERRSIRKSQVMSLAARQTLSVRQRASSDRLSFRSLDTDRESRRSSLERLSLRRSLSDRRLSESERRESVEQRRNFLGSAFEGRTSASRASREDTSRQILESRRSSSLTRMRYETSRRFLGITKEQREASQQAQMRRVSDERIASRKRDDEVSSRLIRDNNIISVARRARRSISLDRSNTNRLQFSRVRRSVSMMNDRRHSFTTPGESNSVEHRRRTVASRNLLADMRTSETSRQQRLSERRDMQERSRAVLRELSLSEVRERARASRERRAESPASVSQRIRSVEERSAARRTISMERQEVRRTRDQDRTFERLSKARTVVERRSTRRTVFDRSFGDRRATFRAFSRSSDVMLASNRAGEHHRIMVDRSALESRNFRSRSAERENRRAISYASSSRRENWENRARTVERRASAPRTAVTRDSTRTLDERNISLLNRRASAETIISADRRNVHVFSSEALRLARYSKTGNRKITKRSALVSVLRSAKVQDARVAMVDSTRLQDASRKLEAINDNARTIRVRALERTSKYRISSASVDREVRQKFWVTARSSQRSDRLNRQLKAISAGQILRRNVRAVTDDVIRRQSANRQNRLILGEIRTTQGNNYQSNRYSRSAELRRDRRYMLAADRKTTLRDSRQSTDSLMSVVQYGSRVTDSVRMAMGSKSSNSALNRERREYWNYARFSRKSIPSQELTRKSQRYQTSVFRKLAVNDNRLIVSKTDSYRSPENIAENVTAKTDMVKDATVEAFNKYNTSWLKDLIATFSMKWYIGALWQHIFLILATLSWTKSGCIETITEKVSSYLFASENMDIFGATKTAAANDRDNLLGTMIGGGAAAAALLLFSTRTK